MNYRKIFEVALLQSQRQRPHRPTTTLIAAECSLFGKKKRDQNNEKKQTPSNTMLNACIHVFITKRRKAQKGRGKRRKSKI
jgi:hypothetical protein